MKENVFLELRLEELSWTFLSQHIKWLLPKTILVLSDLWKGSDSLQKYNTIQFLNLLEKDPKETE